MFDNVSADCIAKSLLRGVGGEDTIVYEVQLFLTLSIFALRSLHNHCCLIVRQVKVLGLIRVGLHPEEDFDVLFTMVLFHHYGIGSSGGWPCHRLSK